MNRKKGGHACIISTFPFILTCKAAFESITIPLNVLLLNNNTLPETHYNN